MTDDLVVFVCARLNERRCAILNGWDADGRARVATMLVGTEPGYTTVAGDHGDDIWVADGREVTDAHHVRVLWDPAAELLEIDAKRQIIAEYDRLRFRDRLRSGEYWNGCHDALRSAVTALALPYASHPDYRQEWRS